MQHFFFDNEKINNSLFTVTGETFIHMSKSLRLKVNEKVVFLDGSGNQYICKIKDIGKDSASIEILSTSKSKSEANIKISIFQCLPKLDKFEDIVKRCVQYGVYEFYPVISNRCIAKLNENKLERLKKISKSAAMQSKRAIVPYIHDAINYIDALKIMCDFDNSILCYENENEYKISDISVKGKSFAALIGPEGGLTEQEVACALDFNIKPVSLGKRILRTEEAAAFLTPIILLKSGDL